MATMRFSDKVGRSLPVSSIFAPVAKLLVTSPPVKAVQRWGYWKYIFSVLLACSIIQRVAGRLQQWRQSKQKRLMQQQGKLRPDPTWNEILGRQGGLLAGHSELVLVGATSFVGVLVTLYKEILNGQFYFAQASGDKRLRTLMFLFPLSTMLAAFISQITETCKAWVALSWRRSVIYKIHDLYFERRAYYHVLNQQGGRGVPDADTRICSDVREACDAYAGVMSGAVQMTISILMQYSSIISRISWIDRSWVLAPPVFVCCVIPMSLAMIDYGKLWPLYGAMQHFNGLYSQALTRVQLHSSSIFMLRGEGYEYGILRRHLDGLVGSFRGMMKATLRKEVIESLLFSGLYPSGFQTLATFTSAGITANEVLLVKGADGIKDMGVHVASHDVPGFFGGYIRNWWGIVTAAGTLSGFFTTWTALAEGQASVNRVTDLFASMQAVRDNLPEAKEGAFQDRGAVIAFEDVTVATPTGQKLVQKLSFEVQLGERLLICGHNGAGKSSIIRCLSALWPIPQGVIVRPGGKSLDDNQADSACKQIYYLPQKPCSIIGSLSDQLTYPARIPGGLPEAELRGWLRCANLEYLADRNKKAGRGGLGKGAAGDDDVDWEQLLSLGEQQALAIARLFYHHPQFAIFDECTSAVSSELETRLFEVARSLGITWITITHRPSLQELHSRMLRLTGHLDTDGRGWELSDIPHTKPLKEVAPHVASEQEALQCALDCIKREVSTRTGAFTTSLSSSSLTGGKKVSLMDEVRSRWPNSFQRFIALIRLGLKEPGNGLRMVGRCLTILVGMRLHCDLLWQLWAGQSGAISAALTGRMEGILAEWGSYMIAAPLISMIDIGIKYQARILANELSEKVSHRLLRLAFSSGGFAGVLRPGSAAHLENPLVRMSDVGGHVNGVASTLIDLLFRVSFGVFSLRTLLRGVGPIALLSPPVYFAVFRLCLYVAPDFAFLSKREADLETRFQVWHTRLRHFAEPVAFSGGGNSERQAIEPHLDAVLDFKFSSLRKKFFYRFVETVFSGHSDIPLYMQRLMTGQFHRRNDVADAAGVSPATVVQGFMFERVVMYNDNTSHRFGSFTPTWWGWDGTHERLLELVVALERASTVETSLTPLAKASEDAGIEVSGLDLITPRGDCLASGISFNVRDGNALIISGPNASGKTLLGSSLLGLFPVEGVIRMPGVTDDDARPPLKVIMPAPQRLYLPSGTLGDQVSYPSRYDPKAEGAAEQEKAMELALSAAGIGYLCKRDARGWSTECRWEDVLSGGEQQRMGVARVLYQKPRFALLDECTSMVAHDSEEALYKSLAHDFNITPITLSQRLFMPDIHTAELKLGVVDGQGWELIDLRHSAF